MNLTNGNRGPGAQPAVSEARAVELGRRIAKGEMLTGRDAVEAALSVARPIADAASRPMATNFLRIDPSKHEFFKDVTFDFIVFEPTPIGEAQEWMRESGLFGEREIEKVGAMSGEKMEFIDKFGRAYVCTAVEGGIRVEPQPVELHIERSADAQLKIEYLEKTGKWGELPQGDRAILCYDALHGRSISLLKKLQERGILNSLHPEKLNNLLYDAMMKYAEWDSFEAIKMLVELGGRHPDALRIVYSFGSIHGAGLDLPHFFIGHAISPNNSNSSGELPLSIAIMHQDAKGVRMLLERGADMHKHDETDETLTPLQCARNLADTGKEGREVLGVLQRWRFNPLNILNKMLKLADNLLFGWMESTATYDPAD